MRIEWIVAAALWTCASAAIAEESLAVVVSRAGSRPPEAGPERNFTGSVRVESRFQTPSPSRVGGGVVTFEPGARTAWHTHPLGQTLIVTAGVGRVQKWGDPVQEIRPGDVVWIPPDVKHWHGAGVTTGMTHVAISEQLDGKSVDWLEKVDDARSGDPTSDAGNAAGPNPATGPGGEPRPFTQPTTPTRAQSLFGDVNPKLAQLTDDVLFGDVWNRPGLSKRDRSLVTVGALIAMNRPEQLRSHLALALTNGVTREELTEAITQLAFYAGWPSGVTATGVAKEVFAAPPAAAATPSAPILIQDQGGFAVGGSVVTNPGTFDPKRPSPDGQTLHGDHARVFYQTPARSRELPLVMWHGFGQSARGWETTPDGREGYQNIFLRRRFPVYLIDQQRRSEAGRSMVAGTIAAQPDDQQWFNTFRFGIWPEFFPGARFSRDPKALEQFFRQTTPDTGPLDAKVATSAVSALFDKIGPGVLVTHSQSGGFGWRVAMDNKNVRAVVSYEPGSGFVFPEGEAPPPMPSASGPLEAATVPLDQFMALTRIPIAIYYGDNIPAEPTDNPGQDNWRVRLAMARLWAEAVNRKGGDVAVVHLPEIGVRGNTHFPFSDLNNIEIADLMSQFLAEKGLDGDKAGAWSDGSGAPPERAVP